VDAAPRLLEACFGAGEQPRVESVRGAVDLQAAQTHYSTGFALLIGLQESVTVACRPSPSSTSRIVFASSSGPWTATLIPDEAADNNPEAPIWQQVVHTVLHGLPEAGAEAEAISAGGLPASSSQTFDVAVVSSIPGTAQDAYFAALAIATGRACGRVGAPPGEEGRIATVHTEMLPALRDVIETVTQRPTSIASLIASHAGTDSPFTLVDTGTYEFLPVETDADSALDWAVIDPGQPAPRPSAWHRDLHKQAEDALAFLRDHGFDDLTSFRNVEHRQMSQVIGVLPASLQQVTRHLITENRRVQKHVAAMRRGDWQMIGALLLMSHASLRDQIQASTPVADAVVDAVESLTLDGVYGACMTTRDGLILATGRPHALDNLLNSIPQAVQQAAEQQGADLHTMHPC